jgi:hypothetical protein
VEKRIPLSSELFSKPNLVDSRSEIKSTKKGKAEESRRGAMIFWSQPFTYWQMLWMPPRWWTISRSYLCRSAISAKNNFRSFDKFDHLASLRFISLQVFPTQSTSRVTKMLISRIFNDPAFGIQVGANAELSVTLSSHEFQARVESVLQPKPPLPPLSASDYLDALVTVREKLSALHLMLLEYCT